MRTKYISFLIAIMIWFVADIIFSFLIKFHTQDLIIFIITLVFLFINALVYGIGYINYKLHEQPYVFMSVLNTCPLILAIVLLFTPTNPFTPPQPFVIAFIFVPIIFDITLVLTLAISGGIGGFDLKPRDTFKYILVTFAFYLIMLIIMYMYYILHIPFIPTSAPPILITIMIYILNYVFLIPLID